MGFSMGMESILVISLSNLHAQLQRQLDHTDIFVICLVIGFEVDEVDSLVIRIVSILHKLKCISSHVLINCVGTTKLN